ncbi:MAG: FtsL-like putative cell division protein, partial [Prevotella sp.]
MRAFKKVIKAQAHEGDRLAPQSLTLKKILGGDILNTNFIRNQIGVLLLITFFLIIFVANRYSVQQDLIKIDKLHQELQDVKYKALSSSSELTEKSRVSNVLDQLKNNKDSVLKIPNQPP